MKKLIFIFFLLPFFSIGQSVNCNVKYIENIGQWNENILFKANIPEGEIFLEDNKFTYSFLDFQTIDSLHHLSHNKNEKDFFNNSIISGFSYKVEFLGSNKNSIKSSSKKLREYHNYFIGNDKKKWKGKVPIYNVVNYTSIYNGIDLKVYSDNQFLKYDFIVKPKVDPKKIQLSYDGITPKINNNQLEINLGFNTIIEQEPYAYQIINGIKKEIKCQYALNNNIISFVFPNGYDNTADLIIDPTLIASTLSGTGAENWGHSATYGMNGEIFTGAISFAQGYPTTIGAFQVNYGGGGTDIAISKLNADGSSLLWATYLGGSNSDYPHSMFANNNNELYVYGSTDSYDYPTASNAFQTANAGGSSDIIVTHLTQDGSNIIGSTYIGGSGDDGRNNATYNYGDQYRGEIIVDDYNNAYIASFSSSSNFPTTIGCYQSVNAGGQDGIALKMNPDLSVLEWSTYLGSTGEDAAFGIRLDNNNNVFVTGTAEINFPTTATSSTPNFIGGTRDAFIAKLNPIATTLLASSYYGSISDDASFFLDVDANNDIYIYGHNNGIIPITPGCYGTANSNQFIAKFDNNLTTINWQTTIGSGGGNDFVPIAFMVDVCSHIYISGHSASTGLFTTANAFYTSGGFYLMSLSPDATNIEFATYYTGNHVDGGTSRFDPSGTIYQGVCSGGGFATTTNAYSTSQSTGWDIGVFKIDFELINFATISASPSDTGCAPFTVDFTNNSSANTYFWDFDDNGQTSNLSDPTYTFNNPGIYNIDFIATDTSSCSMVDTIALEITVLPPLSTSTFDTIVCNTYSWNGTTYTTSGTYNQSFSTNIACDSIAYLNLTVNNSNAGSASVSSCESYSWSANNQNYTASGNYNTTLINQFGCDSLASLDLTIINTVFTSEQIEICDRFTWNINSETYTESGIYFDTITNTNNCDTIITLDLTIIKIPHGYDSVETCYEYTWPLNNLTYSSQGNFTDTIISSLGCDSIVHLILRLEDITFFLPNSFTPNQDDYNELFRVVADEDIQNFEFQIYNRWGKEIFSTNDLGNGWDGTYVNNFVKHGVYVWKVSYSCKGKHRQSIGTVTLIN
jgi:gliding motility-associated-like protein